MHCLVVFQSEAQADVLSWLEKLAIRLKRVSPISPKSTALKKKSSGYDEMSISSIPFSVRQRSKR